MDMVDTDAPEMMAWVLLREKYQEGDVHAKTEYSGTWIKY
jgi:hypothetical protein